MTLDEQCDQWDKMPDNKRDTFLVKTSMGEYRTYRAACAVHARELAKEDGVTPIGIYLDVTVL